MKVAIIGANGFVGTRLVEQFHLGGLHEVIPVVRRPSALALAARFGVESRLADALDPASLTRALEGCDAVVHTALGDPRQIERMPGVLCAAAAKAGVTRLIYLSSASVFGQTPAPGTDERTNLHDRHQMEYNNAKVRGERRFFRGCSTHGLTGFALRPGLVFGPRSRWIADLARDLRRREAWLWAEGSGICNSLYVDNLGEAVTRCLIAPAASAGAYIVGDAERVTWAEFYHTTADSLGIDRGSIHPLTALPAFPRSGRQKVADLVASRPVQSLLPLAPSGAKRLGKRLIEVFTRPQLSADAWSLPPTPRPRLTEEMTLLQQCRWQLPSALAASRLHFIPRVSFQEGLGRSLRWLAFAEGRL